MHDVAGSKRQRRNFIGDDMNKKMTAAYWQLNEAQWCFAQQFIILNNATKAAVAAGYSPDNPAAAQVTGSRLLSNAMVLNAVAFLAGERAKRLSITADYVLSQAVKLHERCMQEVRPKMVKVGKEWVQATDEDGCPVFQFDASAAARSLELVGKHVDIQAFKDKIEIESDLIPWTAIKVEDHDRTGAG